MVQLMLEGLGGDRRYPGGAEGRTKGIECYHVNARLSRKLEDIGDLRVGKLLLLICYCLQAIWYRIRYGVRNFYYIPAPGKRSALLRDWVVMAICRPFFKRTILHWHAAGLAKWLETSVQMRARAFTFKLMREADLSIVLSRFNRADAEKILSKRIQVVSNGIPDPCPDFEKRVLPVRRARLAARRAVVAGKPLGQEDLKETRGDPRLLRVLYLAHCTREKGLFDAVAGICLAQKRLSERRSPICLRLQVTGNFVTKQERQDFDNLMAEPEVAEIVQYLGFVGGEEKNRLLAEADIFCSPTYYRNENQPVNLIEAMAFGLPILATRWRSLPELFPSDYPGLVDVRSPEQIANALPALMTGAAGDGFRELFLRNYTIERHLSGLAEAFKSAETAAVDDLPQTLNHPSPASARP
jgi:glycosyltransferase involved in cell wall biosynthesis